MARGLRLGLVALLASALAGCHRGGGSMSDGGMRAVGVLKAIQRHTVPSLFAGKPGQEVSRLDVDLESLTSAAGASLDKRDLLGLSFEGPPDLADRFKPGDRVEIVTTTPTGMHIARIALVTVH